MSNVEWLSEAVKILRCVRMKQSAEGKERDFGSSSRNHAKPVVGSKGLRLLGLLRMCHFNQL